MKLFLFTPTMPGEIVIQNREDEYYSTLRWEENERIIDGKKQ
jgi:hypothetical protein